MLRVLSVCHLLFCCHLASVDRLVGVSHRASCPILCEPYTHEGLRYGFGDPPNLSVAFFSAIICSMKETGAPMTLVSACLLGLPCRYDGRARPHAALQKLAAGGGVLPCCPEVLAGMVRGAVLVARPGRLRRLAVAVADARRRIEAAGAVVLGLVINRKGAPPATLPA